MADFFGFTPESFEQFVRALSVCVFGPSVTVFGDGPDRGREAIFRGTVTYPAPPAVLWSGYGVIQAKCKTRTGGTGKDQEWALDQLQRELKKFVAQPTRREKPEYYIFATNVHLSSAGRGWDAGDELIRSYTGKIPSLRGHALWGADQLAGFLDVFTDLRRRFTAHLTSGDVLAALLAEVERKHPSSQSVLAAYVESGFRADVASRLDQAGNRTDEQLRLADLFFDLPASAGLTLTAPDETADHEGRLPPGVLAELLQAGSRQLDPETVYEQETATNAPAGGRFPTRFVLLGGFGSGKSTVAQFLAQIHRAALLARRPPHELESTVRASVAAIQARCEREGLQWPATPRYPFRVELVRFARALAGGQTASLTSYLLTGLRGEFALPYEALREWLGRYPWLLILDGLDEVPATSNRTAVVTAVDDFLAEARRAGADLFVVATSRRDGYDGEFRSGVVALRHVRPLSTTRALRYVEYYAQTRFGATDPNRADDVLAQLTASVTNPLTAQLMGTPLQVTFMATVVAARGNPGSDRWQLFAKYYQTVYDRELQKAVPPYDRVFADHTATITRLHHDVGFWLQCRGEVAGDEATSLSITRFQQLAREYLGADGYSGDELDRLVEVITDAARKRLVFLTSRLDGELAFDVRGIQEYMAAECLMTGDRQGIRDRLRAVAPHVYWRNTFLFAVGKCFADAQSRHLQDEVRLLCEDANDSADLTLAAVRIGSELALAILESGAVAQNRAHARHLAKIALGLVADVAGSADADQASPAVRLAAVYQDHLESLYHDELRTRVGQTDVARTTGAWPLVVGLAARGIGWSQELLAAHWPLALGDQQRVLAACVRALGWSNELISRAVTLIPQMQPIEAQQLYLHDAPDAEPLVTWFDALPHLLGVTRPAGEWLTCPLRFGAAVSTPPDDGLALEICSLNLENAEVFDAVAEMPPGHPGWEPLRRTAEFLAEPTPEALAYFLRGCADAGYSPNNRTESFTGQLPWPLAACLRAAATRDDLSRFADMADRGDLGSRAEWEAAEERWATRGVWPEDLLHVPSDGPPFPTNTATRGFPVAAASLLITHREYPNDVWDHLLDLAERGGPSVRVALLWFCGSRYFPNRLHQPDNCRRIESLIRSSAPSSGAEFVRQVRTMDLAALDEPALAAYTSFANACGLFLPVASLRAPNVKESLVTYWQTAFVRDPELVGLLCLLVSVAGEGTPSDLIPDDLLRLPLTAEPRCQLAAVTLRALRPTLTAKEVPELTRELCSVLAQVHDPEHRELLFDAIERHLTHRPALEKLVLSLRDQVPDADYDCVWLLRHALRMRKSELGGTHRLVALRLPNLAPSENASSGQAP